MVVYDAFHVAIQSLDGRAEAAYSGDESGVHFRLRLEACNGESVTTWDELGAAPDVSALLCRRLREAAFDLRDRIALTRGEPTTRAQS